MVKSDDGSASATASSSATTTQRKSAKHTHLGLRPKKSDSLHTRLRTSNPQPKHVSKIVDITSVEHARSRSANNGAADSVRSSRNASEVGDASRHPSREGSLSLDSEHEEEPLAGKGQDAEGEEEDVQTTDIGIYDDTVYDEYLGTVMGLIRRLLVRSLEWETPILAKHQALVRSPTLDTFFVYTSLVGSHSFFLIFLPISFWLISGPFSRGLVNVLAFGVYFSSAIKDALCIPRPYSPPVTRLVIGTFHLEYGFPSTHSTNCISVVLYCYLWLNTIRLSHDAGSPMQSWAWEAGLTFYAVSVFYGRIYSGMHSIMDCVAGSLLGALITLVQWHFRETMEVLMVTQGLKVSAAVWIAGLVAVIVHPQPLDDCPCFEDAIAFLSVVIGIVTGRTIAVRFNLTPTSDPVLPISVKDRLVAKVMDAIDAQQSSNNDSLVSQLARVSKMAVVLVVGVSLILLTRITVKTICNIVLPPIFRFVQGTFGFILPRRHYTSSTDYAAMQKANREGTSTTLSTGHSSLHARKASLSKNANIRPTSMETEGLRNRMRSHSLQGEKGGELTVKFTMGDGKDIPVPFTHPNTQLPGDKFSDRIAGALHHDERQRQRKESESSIKTTTSVATITPQVLQHGSQAKGGALANGQAEEAPVIELAHYDVDVLTKVLVYSAIGMAAASLIPALFYQVGLLPV